MTDFTTILKDADGNPLRDDVAMQSNGGAAVELSLGRACAHALLQGYVDEPTLSGEDKFKRAMLAVKIGEATELALPSEDITLVKTVVAKLYGAIVVYRAWCLLDPALAPAAA